MFWGVTLPPYRILMADAASLFQLGLHEQPDRAMHGHGLLRGGGLSCTDGPNRFVGDRDWSQDPVWVVLPGCC